MKRSQLSEATVRGRVGVALPGAVKRSRPSEATVRGRVGLAPPGAVKRGDAGQATVEIVAALPVVVAVALAAFQVLAAGLARELADHAAEAGAVAALQERDAADAARRALPGWARSRISVAASDGAVRVRLRPPTIVPGTGHLLTATASARTTGSGLALRHRAVGAGAR